MREENANINYSISQKDKSRHTQRHKTAAITQQTSASGDFYSNVSQLIEGHDGAEHFNEILDSKAKCKDREKMLFINVCKWLWSWNVGVKHKC